MPCTTILIGKKASYDGSTIIARNDDSASGVFHVKKLVVVKPEKQPRLYKSKIAHLEIPLPENPLRYTAMPNVDPKEGMWAAAGVNEDNVGMSATETITSNARVLGADPYVKYEPAHGQTKAVMGGIGEEDLVAIVLPYVRSAREGVKRLGELLSRYGTYEPNGIAFNDKDECWWLETIGGHHYLARRVEDDEYVSMPNQFGLDRFDFDDALGQGKNNLCSSDLKDFVEKNHLALDLSGSFNPRLAFGSHDDSDHVYNTPRAWFMLRYFNPRTYAFDGEGAHFTPESDDLPWSLKPERKITIEEVKYILSSHFQGTPYDCYGKENPKRGIYRPIGVNRTAFLGLIQIRPYLPKEIQALEWLAFGSNVFNAMPPFYASAEKVPAYFGNTTLQVSSDNFYWASRLLGALADPHFGTTAIQIERYQEAVANRSHELLNVFDARFLKERNVAILEKANAEIATMTQKETDKALDKVLYESSCRMKNAYARSDN